MNLYLASDISVLQALTSSVLGMAIVFLALIALMIVIVLLSKAMKAGGKKGNSQAAAEASESPTKAETPYDPVRIEPQSAPAAVKAEAPAASQILAPGSAGPLLLRDVEEKDAALLMAIVAYRMKKPLCQLRFISIKQVYETGGSK